MEINGHSAKVSIWLGHITFVHIHTKFEDALLNTSAVISKTALELVVQN